MIQFSRSQRIREAKTGVFEVAVIGGGIHGAAALRDAAIRGYRTLLLEAQDFAFGTSSRSSKLAHGGVRYLQQGDVRLVMEALRERSRLLLQAPHLVRPQRFLFPILKENSLPAWQIHVGLKLYEILGRLLGGQGSEAERIAFPRSRRLGPRSRENQELRHLGLKSENLFAYADAQIDDARLVVENIVDAEQCSAIPLNYSRVCAVSREGSRWLIEWRDEVTGEEHTSRADFLILTAGPWLPQFMQTQGLWRADWPEPVLSRGSHLVFSEPWKLSPLILPSGEKGRYYFVLPHRIASVEQTLVGTTDRLIASMPEDPQPSNDEISELLSFLKRDLPQSKLNESNLQRTFTGVRLLARHSSTAKQRPTSELRRREFFLSDPQLVSFLGGKYTTARHTAEKLVDFADAFFNKKSNLEEIRSRPLPGGWDFSGSRKERLSDLLLSRFPETQPQCIERLLECFGARAEQLLGSNSLLEGLLTYVVQVEHAVSQEDVLERRLGLGVLEPEQEQQLRLIFQRLSLF